MSGLESDTIGGFNAMLEKQKKQEGEALVSCSSMKQAPYSATKKPDEILRLRKRTVRRAA